MSIKQPDWYRMMSVTMPSGPSKGRPRRLSIHTITAVCGRDGEKILREMEDSKEVVGYVCPDVHTPIFYLLGNINLPGMIDSRSKDCFDKAREWLKRFPTSKVKGFKRFPMYKKDKNGNLAKDTDHVHRVPKTDSSWGCPDECYTMEVPFERADEEYEKLVREAVKG